MAQFNLEKKVGKIIIPAIHDLIRYYFKSEHNSDVDELRLEALTYDILHFYAYGMRKYGKYSIIDASITACLVYDGKSPSDPEAVATFSRLHKVFHEDFKNITAVLMETNGGYEIETNDE